MKNWKKQFELEFGIHFSESELQFAVAFVEDLLKEQKKKIRKEFKDWFNKGSELIEDAIKIILN